MSRVDDIVTAVQRAARAIWPERKAPLDRIKEAIYSALLPFVDDIPVRVAVTAFSGTSHVPEQRGDQIRQEYSEQVVNALHRIERAAKTPETVKLVPELFESYREGFRTRYLAWLHSRAGVMSTMITGGSNFPVARQQKIGDASDRRAQEMYEWSNRALAAIIRKLTEADTEATGGEVAKIERALADRRKLAAIMPAANRIVRRKAGTREEKYAELRELGIPERSLAGMFERGDFGDIGFPAYAMANNNKEIKRLEARLDEVKTREATGDVEVPFEGGTVEYADDRLRIRYDVRQPAEVIEQLKRNGFKWSPSNTAWQRQLTANAVMVASRLLGVQLPALGASS